MMTSGKLEAIASRLPSMGGREIGPFLRHLARQVPVGTQVVELGAWLGAASAQLALGLAERRGDAAGQVGLSCFDRWQPSDNEIEEAARQGMELMPGMNTLPVVEEVLSHFPVHINYCRGEISRAQWDGGPIGVFVDHTDTDDITATRQMLRVFGPSWLPGQCVLVFLNMGDGLEAAIARGCPRARLIQAFPDSFLEVHTDLGMRGRAWFYARAVDASIWSTT